MFPKKLITKLIFIALVPLPFAASAIDVNGDGAAVKTAISNVMMMQDIASQRGFALRSQERIYSIDEGWKVWGSLLADQLSSDHEVSYQDFESTTVGVMVGADMYVDEKNAYFGFSLAYLDSQADVLETDKSVDIASYQYLAYGGWRYENVLLDSMINIGYGDVDTKRSALNTTANYIMLNGGVKVALSYQVETDYGYIEPFVAYDMQLISYDDYQESGSDEALRFDRETYTTQYTQLGLNLYKDFETKFGVLSPSLKLDYRFDLDPDQRIHEQVQLANEPLDRDGFESFDGALIGGDMLVTKVGLNLEKNENLILSAYFIYMTGETVNSYSGMLNASYHF